MADADYTNERWVPIPGYEGHYEVSDMGRVRSLPRTLPMSGSKGRRYPGKILSTRARPRPTVSLHHPDKPAVAVPVHRVVLLAFVGPLPDGLVTRHLNDDKADNRLSNLAYGTYSENMLDRVENGIHWNAVKSECPRGHEYSPENTFVKKNGARECRTCRRNYHREYQRKLRAKKNAAALASN